MRPERQQQIVLLERTIDSDGLTPFDYAPPTATGAARARNTKAEAHEGNEQTILCRACRGGPKQRICRVCKGTGAEVVDQYTQRRLATETQEGEAPPPRMVRCDECGGSGFGRWWRNGDQLSKVCRRCRGVGRVPAPEFTVRPFREVPLSADAAELGPGDPVVAALEIGIPGVGKAYERRRQAGSYEELGLALGALRLEHRSLYRLNVRVFVVGEVEEAELGANAAALLEHSLVYLDSLMPAEIRVPDWAARYESERREAERERQAKSEAAA